MALQPQVGDYSKSHTFDRKLAHELWGSDEFPILAQEKVLASGGSVGHVALGADNRAGVVVRQPQARSAGPKGNPGGQRCGDAARFRVGYVGDRIPTLSTVCS